jgi:hypothetical protein
MKFEFLAETNAILTLRREADALDRAAGVSFRESRACEASALYFLKQRRDLEAKLRGQLDRRVEPRGGPENRKSARPAGVGLGPQKVRIRIVR